MRRLFLVLSVLVVAAFAGNTAQACNYSGGPGPGQRIYYFKCTGTVFISWLEAVRNNNNYTIVTMASDGVGYTVVFEKKK